MARRLLVAALLGLVSLAVPSVAAARPLPASWERGFNFTGYWHSNYEQSAAATSLERLARTGANAVAIYTTWYQDTPQSTQIGPDAERTPTESGVVARIRQAHALGLKVMLRAHVSSVQSPEWRGFFRPSDVNAWFASYRAMIRHFAEVAQAEGVESFEVGSEFVTLSGFDAQWRAVVADARARFRGTLLYAADWSEVASVRWLDAVDVIGVDAYYSLSCSSSETPSEDALVAAWAEPIAQLAQISARFGGKPIVFPEVGYRNIAGSTCNPWDYQRGGARDDAAQQRALVALFRVFADKPWFRGLYLWRWHWDLAAPQPTDFPVTGKPAEDTVREWFTQPAPSGTPPPQPPPQPPQPPPQPPQPNSQPPQPNPQPQPTTSPSAGPQAAGETAASPTTEIPPSLRPPDVAPSPALAPAQPSLRLRVATRRRTLVVRGKLIPARRAIVRIVVERRDAAGRWRRHAGSRTRAVTGTGAFARRIPVSRRGRYRVRAAVSSTSARTRAVRVG